MFYDQGRQPTTTTYLEPKVLYFTSLELMYLKHLKHRERGERASPQELGHWDTGRLATGAGALFIDILVLPYLTLKQFYIHLIDLLVVSIVRFHSSTNTYTGFQEFKDWSVRRDASTQSPPCVLCHWT